MDDDGTSVNAVAVVKRWLEITDALALAGIAPDVTTVLAMAMGVKALGIPVGNMKPKTPGVMGFVPGPKRGD